MAKLILHMLSPLKHMSPFDVNMALDAGYDSVTPYTNVTLEEIEPLVQDAMFSRSPRDAVRTGVFIAGKDAIQALDMIEKAKKTLLKPFEISIFADPAGSFTTAAAMVACVEKVLKEKKKRALSGTKVVVYGATGVVGFSSARHRRAGRRACDARRLQRAGARRKGDARNQEAFRRRDLFRRRQRSRESAQSARQFGNRALRRPGRRADPFRRRYQARRTNLLVCADVNAVPPLGIEGVDLHDDGKELPGGSCGIGALAIGNVKYQTEFRLFKKMATSDTPLCIDFRDAFKLARELV